MTIIIISPKGRRVNLSPRIVFRLGYIQVAHAQKHLASSSSEARHFSSDLRTNLAQVRNKINLIFNLILGLFTFCKSFFFSRPLFYFSVYVSLICLSQYLHRNNEIRFTLEVFFISFVFFV